MCRLACSIAAFMVILGGIATIFIRARLIILGIVVPVLPCSCLGASCIAIGVRVRSGLLIRGIMVSV